MITCPKCGHSNPAQSNFCAQCGTPLNRPERPGEATAIIPIVNDEVVVVDDLSAEDEAALSTLRRGSALLIVRRPLQERFLLDQDKTTAGRHPGADIFLDDITVSRHHAEFTLTADGSVSVRDLGSLNGTYVNRTLVDQPVALRTGDEVQIGKYKMVVFMGGTGTR